MKKLPLLITQNNLHLSIRRRLNTKILLNCKNYSSTKTAIMKKLLIPVMILIGFSSCSNYYKAITAAEPTKAASFSDFQDTKKYYILRNGGDAFVMKNISISSDHKNVQCTLEELPLDHKLYVANGTQGKMKYKIKSYSTEDETGVLNEVHIYLTAGSKTAPGAYTLALENIQKAEIIEKDKLKTKRSHAMGTGIAIGTTVLVVGAVVVIAISSSLASAF
jgi:hypothetical protein